MLRRWSVLSLLPLLVSSVTFAGAHPVAAPAMGSMPGVGSMAISSDGNSAITVFDRADAIYAVRVEDSAPPSQPFVIASILGYAKPYTLNAVWTGSMHWVSWADAGGTQVVRLHADGSVIDRFGIDLKLAFPRAAGSHQRVAFVGHAPGSYQVRAIVFDESGGVIAPEFTPIATFGHDFEIAPTITGFLITVSSHEGLEAARIAIDGQLVDSPPLVLERFGPSNVNENRSGAARIASDDDGSIVVWTTDRRNEPRRIRSARIDRDGTVSEVRDLGVATPRISIETAALNGPQFVVLLKDWLPEQNASYELFAVDRSGNRLSGTFRFADECGHASAIARTGSRQIVAWTRLFPNGSRVDATSFLFGAIPVSSGLESRTLALSRGEAIQKGGVVASDGTNWLASWIEVLAETTMVKAIPVSPEGMPLRVNPIVVRSTKSLLHDPRVVFSNGVYFIAWLEGWQLMLARVSHDGELLDPQPQRLSQTAADFGLVATDRAAAVVWSNEAENITSCEIAIVSSDGFTLNSNRINVDTPSIPGELLAHYLPQIVRHGDRLVIAYVLVRSNFPCQSGCPPVSKAEVRAVRFALGGYPADTRSWLLAADTVGFSLGTNGDEAVLVTRDTIRKLSIESDITAGPDLPMHFSGTHAWIESLPGRFVALYPFRGYVRLEPFTSGGTRPGPVRQIDGTRSNASSLAANDAGDVLVAFSRSSPRDQRVYVVLDDEMTLVTTRARPLR
ncbi:MAG: hypothetical protein ACYC7A_13180 [Thermoanaerobaculia bacterium]